MNAPQGRRRTRVIRRVLRAVAVVGAIGFGFLSYLYLTLPDVRPLARTNPATTAFMDMRAREARDARRPVRRALRWVPYSRISPHLKRAVLVAEDDAFFEHDGIDINQIRKSIEADIASGRAVRGASTITQQLAKNLYLSPSRNPLRKLRELLITRRLEAELSKARIFELYLNVIEWGDGIWGAEAASRAYFGVSATDLTRDQAGLLAACIINPRVLNPAHPRTRLIRRQQMILARMGGVEPPSAETTAAPGAPTEPVEQEEIERALPRSDDDFPSDGAPDELPANGDDLTLPK